MGKNQKNPLEKIGLSAFYRSWKEIEIHLFLAPVLPFDTLRNRVLATE